MTVGERIDSGLDKMKGKGNQIAGDVRDDPDQKAKGHAQELKGDLRDVKTDIKDAFRKK